MMSPKLSRDPPGTNWIAVMIGCLPLLSMAFTYVAFALAPAEFEEDSGLTLSLLFLVEVPACLLVGAFAGAMAIEGSAMHRILSYVVVLGLILALSGMGALLYDDVMGPALGWLAANHVLALASFGRSDVNASARISAIGEDTVSQVILTVWCALGLIVLALLLIHFAPDMMAATHLNLQWTDLAWIGAAHFTMRAIGVAYVKSAAFEREQRGLLDRPWVHKLIFHLGGSNEAYDSP